MVNRFDLLKEDLNIDHVVLESENQYCNNYNVDYVGFDKYKKINFDKDYKKKNINKKESNGKNQNLKKILCHNMITSNICSYGNKCLYAHSLDEQRIDTDKKLAYELMFTSNDLSHIDLQKDIALYRSLLRLTKMCENCDNKKCTGGYNCKFGACAKKYHICIKDLNNGDCNGNCDCVHLTKRGMKPLYYDHAKISSGQYICGTLLSAEFIKNLETSSEQVEDLLSNISLDSDTTNNSDECEQSIFESN